jgi:hypothetical protein
VSILQNILEGRRRYGSGYLYPTAYTGDKESV